MPTLHPYALTFRGGLRIGTRGANQEATGLVLPSDTLFAALVDCHRRRGMDVGSWLAPFLGASPEPPFLLTSAFPYAGEVRFYPPPAELRRFLSADALKGRGKQLKRVKFISEGLLLRALAGQKLDGLLFPEREGEEPTGGAGLQGGALWLSAAEIERLPAEMRRPAGKRHALAGLALWKESILPHVTIDRVTSASTVFQSGRITFAPGCGLWFGVEWRAADAAGAGETYAEALRAALGMLEHDGLGADRSTGGGAFSVDEMPAVELPAPRPGAPAYLLNRYHPRPAELPGALAHPGCAYRLSAVGGWVNTIDGAAQRRKRVQMVAEGSLVAPPAWPAGDLAEVAPRYDTGQGGLPHPVYRCGLALAAGLAESEGSHA